jgi:hypothetical protein
MDKLLPSILPKRYSSFLRQLNLYDFERVSTGPYRGAYCHDMFIKEKPELCQVILRHKIKGNSMAPTMTYK